jgi:hypothetical protein
VVATFLNTPGASAAQASAASTLAIEAWSSVKGKGESGKVGGYGKPSSFINSSYRYIDDKREVLSWTFGHVDGSFAAVAWWMTRYQRGQERSS